MVHVRRRVVRRLLLCLVHLRGAPLRERRRSRLEQLADVLERASLRFVDISELFESGASPFSNSSLMSSSARPFVSWNVKNTCTHDATQNTAKMMYVFHWMLRNAGGTNCIGWACERAEYTDSRGGALTNARAKFMIQFVLVASPAALARTGSGNISAIYSHETGPCQHNIQFSVSATDRDEARAQVKDAPR